MGRRWYMDEDAPDYPKDSLYKGHIKGYHYEGDGYYANNRLGGSDLIIEEREDGSYDIHETM